MAKLTRLTAEQRENLTAYLDEELDDNEAIEIERALADSPVVRHEVDMLARTWDLLDVLPSAKATEGFSRRTLSTIRAADEPPPDRRFEIVLKNARRAVVLAAWAAALAVMGWVGFEATSRWVPQENAELLKDFNVIANYDALSAVGDSEFLETLYQKRTFADYHDSQDN